jgi:hypothetical protein
MGVEQPFYVTRGECSPLCGTAQPLFRAKTGRFRPRWGKRVNCCTLRRARLRQKQACASQNSSKNPRFWPVFDPKTTIYGLFCDPFATRTKRHPTPPPRRKRGGLGGGIGGIGDWGLGIGCPQENWSSLGDCSSFNHSPGERRSFGGTSFLVFFRPNPRCLCRVVVLRSEPFRNDVALSNVVPGGVPPNGGTAEAVTTSAVTTSGGGRRRRGCRGGVGRRRWRR